ncbi:MAG: ABC transporter permease subunit [Leptolyngbyaceae bacterium]|nr:ABC transporter permease subunit [Leptolyngbyaceae bacterium]
MFSTLLNPFQDTVLPLGEWVEGVVNWLVENYRWFFQLIRLSVVGLLNGIVDFLVAMPQLLFLVILGLIAWQLAGRRIAIFSIVGMVLIGLMGAWEETMVTLGLVITAVALCILVGLPLGIFSASNDLVERIMRPILDTMQTLPAFVYLIPVVMLFSAGEVSGVIVTFVFAVPPLIRLTNIGIRQVQEDVVEAAHAFGSTPRQILFEVKLPLAMPTILAGVNQSLMLALSMVVIASLIAVPGLGQMVNRGIGRLDVGLAATGGLCIVLMAIILDRITQAAGQHDGVMSNWSTNGPLGAINQFYQRMHHSEQPAPLQ